MIRLNVRPLAAALLLPIGGCRPAPNVLRDADAAAAARAALATLFLEREHARQLVLWRGARRDAPTLGALAGAEGPADTLALLAPDPARLALPVPVHVVGLAEVEAHFAAHPDAWAAWFARYPASGGIVEVTRPRPERGSAARAWLVVGRACGEHCRMAWRATVARGPGGVWRTEAITPVRLPRS